MPCNELAEEATIRRIRIVQTEGTREVAREISFYNLDAIISVGYRVNSSQATQFRIWATQTLREFIVKGFVLDDDRLKLNRRFGKDSHHAQAPQRRVPTDRAGGHRRGRAAGYRRSR